MSSAVEDTVATAAPAVPASTKEFMAPTRVVLGEGALDRLAAEADALGSRPLVVTDPGVRAAGLLDLVLHCLGHGDREVAVYDQVKGNPTETHVHEAVDVLRANDCDVVVAVGGGSALDTGKAVAIVAANGGAISDYEGDDVFDAPPIPIIAVPTTVGTGSEVTKGSVISSNATGLKMVIVSQRLYASVALLDPRAVETLPPPIAAATGIDALVHAIEGYVARGATPISDALNLHSIRLGGEHLRPAVAGTREGLYGMLVASCVTGEGFHNAGLGLAHALANAVQGHFSVHHGAACGVFLPHVMAYNLIACPERFVDIAVALGEPVSGLSQMDAARCSVGSIRQLMDDIGVPKNLRELGVEGADFDQLAQEAYDHFDRPPNPRASTVAELRALYEAAA